MLKHSPESFSFDNFSINRAGNIKGAEPHVPSLSYQQQIDAFFVKSIWGELQVTFALKEHLILAFNRFQNGLDGRLASLLSFFFVWLDFDLDLIEFKDFTVYVDMVLCGAILTSVFRADAILHNDPKRRSVSCDALYQTEIKRHSVVMLASVHVCSQEALVLTQGVLFAFKSIVAFVERDAWALPSHKSSQLIFSERCRPVKRFMRSIKGALQL